MVNQYFSYYSGTEAMMMLQAKELQKNGHEVYFFGSNRKPYIDSDYQYLHLLPERKVGTKNYLKNPINYYYDKGIQNALNNIIEEIKPDIIHCQYIDTLTYSIFNCFRDIPTVLTFHSSYVSFCPTGLLSNKNYIDCPNLCKHGNFLACIKNDCKNNIEASIRRAIFGYVSYKNFKNVDMYITPSEALRQKCINADIGIKPEQIVTINNFISDEQLQTIPNYTNKKYFLYVGRLVKHKGVKYILEAAKDLPRDIEFHIVGTGEEEKNLKEYAKQNNLDNVKFLGYKSGADLQEEYQNCIAIIVPSIWLESFGMINVEAFINGKPVIGSRIGGIPEVVDNDINGLLFEPTNVEQLKQKILMYWNNPELVIKHGKNGYEKTKKKYTPQRYYEQLMKVYNEVLKVNEN